jgi:uncharacterized protein (DUF1697 family)
MTTFVALLRGINVGRANRIAMADLRDLVSSLGHREVRTLVNSGNVVFTAEDEADPATVAAGLEEALATRLRVAVPVVVRTGPQMAGVVARNPFPAAAATPKLLHVAFLAAAPGPDRVAALQEVERGEDDFRVIGTEVYLHYPLGLSGAVFLASGLDRVLGVTATARNWNTVTRLAELAAG